MMTAIYIKLVVALLLLVAGGLCAKEKPIGGAHGIHLVCVLMLAALAGYGLYLL